jgi:hypothetical protein
MALYALVFLFLGSCGRTPAEKAEYLLELKGSVAEAGVIEYAGLGMNVYRDFRSNPCGDCPDQPVSVYVGATAEEVAGAMAEAVERADDMWSVKELKGAVLLLEEKEIAKAKEPAVPAAPKGLNIHGTFTPAR